MAAQGTKGTSGILSEGHDGCAGHEGDFWDPE